MVQWVSLQCVIVVFPDYTHFAYRALRVNTNVMAIFKSVFEIIILISILNGFAGVRWLCREKWTCPIRQILVFSEI